MRQVPHYLIIGNGRLSKHIQHYFSLLAIPYQSWNRSQPIEQLSSLAQQATHILLLIKDCAIDAFIQEHLLQVTALRIHCSGSLTSEHAYGVHPLYCFTERLYGIDEYLEIPFVIDDDAPDFATVLPGLPNRHIRLNKSLKAKYHALCVLGANFSCLLWQKLFSNFEQELSIPQAMAHPYLMQQTKNLLTNYQAALTGPLVRNDQQTIAVNLQALTNDPIQAVYQSFVTYYQQLTQEKSV